MAFEQCNRLRSLLSGFNKPWFIAGGWAIDLLVGEETREHKDIEIAIFRNDQIIFKEHLQDWKFKKVCTGEFQIWRDELLELPVHEVHAVNKKNGDHLEILLNESKENHWIFRRDLRISYPVHLLFRYTENSIPFLSPEIVLLYKAKNTREKDHQDFMRVKDFSMTIRNYGLKRL
ncbi:hypothetical protein QUF79_04410 [Fictibacillus enclensis]|uniref:nucleotidyltransferase domain-containing protein n=1 Tax=Fictibacillus enclensis TaxID=1017270 RepID=UPI0025A0D2D3|nr:hypothetical protein [Fictibacillus enclensis]MDM5197272.1 hypothetical protein [Fictibacillus enclensis]